MLGITVGGAQGVTAVLDSSKTLITVTVPNKKITGEYTVKLVKTDGGSEKLDGAKFKVTLPGGSEQEYTTNASGEITLPEISITEAGTDTIKIQEIQAPTGYSKIIDTITLQVTKGIESGKYVATNAQISSGSVEGVKTTIDTSKTLITVTIPNEKITGDYTVKLLKVDKNNTNTKLEGAKFKITLPNGSSAEYTTNANGEIALPDISITGTGTDTITIEETEAPSGYNKIINTLKLQITKGLQSEKYVVTNAEIKEGQVEGVSTVVDSSKTIVTVTIPNEKITGGYSVKLVKTDGESAKLEGAKFKVTLPDGSSSEYTTSSNGEITIPTITIAETGTDEITIEETEAPAGYNKIIGTLKLQVTKGVDSGKYIATNAQITEGQVEGVTAQLNTEKTIITVTIPNEKITGGYTIKLVKTDKDSVNTKLEGAKFKVTLPGGAEQEYTTNSSGEITIPTITITGTGTDTIKIEETEAPKGYNKIIETLTLQVTKGIESGKYVVTNAGITEGQVEGVTTVVDSSKTIITVTIPNIKKAGGYVLKLLKVDSNNPEQKLQGAVFNVTLPGNDAKEYTTNENGEITLPSVEIAELGTDTITISEVKLPDGYYYISKDITLQVTKTDDGTKYVASDVKITNGEVQGVSVNLDKDAGTILLTIPNKKITGEYKLQLVKVDSTDTNKVLQGAKFKVTLADGTSNEYVTNEQGIISISNINISQEGTDTITIEELEAPEKYYSMIGTIKVNVTKEAQEDKYVATKVEFTQDSQTNGSTVTVNDGVITVKVPNRPKQFDLKLIKRIVEVNGEKVPERLEGVDITGLANGTSTTADYKMNKTPVAVKQGDIVKYTLRVYNEGEIDGYASEISEDIPEGLEFLWSEKDGAELDSDTTLSEKEKEAIRYNQGIWSIKDFDTETNRVEMISTDYLAKGKGEELITEGANLIKAFDAEKAYIDTETEKNPDYKEVSVYLKVIANNDLDTVIRNEAAITGDTDSDGNPVDDRDSTPEDWVKYEDDEDYDNVELKIFDLALRKFIIAVSQDVTIEDNEYLKNADGTYTRAPQVDASKLNTTDAEGNAITTAIYNHTKEPVEVKNKDYIIYMLRVYNEGDIAGYATEITDYLPAGLEFVEGDFNTQYGWEVSEDGRKVTTRYLENQLINAVQVVDGENVLSYKEVPIMCRLSDGAEYNTYTDTIAEAADVEGAGKTAPNKLYGVDTFTDSEKNLKGTARPYFMYLAPNSITKVRVYIWIEGQDIDNYDFAQLGRQISVNFGFTKERFTEDDVNYDGPSTDVTPHVVEYHNTDTVTTISNSSVYFVDALDQFIIPVDVTDNFTFNDGAAQKTATYDAGQKTWSIA